MNESLSMEELSFVSRQEHGIAAIDNSQELKQALAEQLVMYKNLVYKWLSGQFETYEAFCAAVEEHFGFSIVEIPEDKWELEKEGVRFLNNDNWLDFAMDYMGSLYPSSDFGFAF